ncbi:hypothetical protein ACJMK2_023111 [Sinanodonta woodiana]|uniref:Spaetzle domain-containing protein n=1 Tax=Sinanodonta woodiana TaxID=1069815 RepID=A0ABD3T4G6_SINWO
MLALNGNTLLFLLFLAVLVVIQGNFVHSTFNCKDELDGQWRKTEPFNLELPDIDPVAITKLFPGLFYTEAELMAIETQEDSFREQRLSFETSDYKEILSLPGDGSMCCVTKGGHCPGRCFQEYRQHQVLVCDFKSNRNPPVKFEFFKIPAYCVCKNISPK